MSKFSLKLRKEYDFDGDKVVFELKRLTRANALLIMPHVEKIASAATDDQAAKVDLPSTMDFMEAAGKVLKDSVKDMFGLFIDEEEVKPCTELFDTVVDSVYFLNLIVQVVNDLVTESFLKENDGKKSEEP